MTEPDDNVKELDGVGPKTGADLKASGRGTVRKLATANPDTLPENTSLGEKKSKDLVQTARNALRGGSPFENGLDFEKEQNNMGTISTGSDDLDGLLRGGIAVGYLTEAFGLSSSGKSQLAFQLCVNAQLPEDEGGAGNGDMVIFIDVEETFRADRIRSMAKAAGLDPDEALSNIEVARPTDVTDQERAIQETRQFDLDNVALIVVDSISGHVRNEYQGRENFGERSDRFGGMLEDLSKMASGETGHDIAVFYPNQAGKKPQKQYGDPVYSYGASTLEHQSSFRMRLDARGSKGYNASLADSPNLPPGECYFDIYECGINDQDHECEICSD
jgi:DNA repair protein RadA